MMMTEPTAIMTMKPHSGTVALCESSVDMVKVGPHRRRGKDGVIVLIK